MSQGPHVASAQATDRRYGNSQPAPAKPALSGPGRRRRITLAPAPESVKAARDFTAAILRRWHLDSLIDDAVIIASELVTNAIRHGTAAVDCPEGSAASADDRAGAMGPAGAATPVGARAEVAGPAGAADSAGSPGPGTPGKSTPGKSTPGKGTPGAGAGRVELTWALQTSRLICVVTDQAGTPPARAPENPEAESGHGLQIVEALTVAWGWTILGTGEKAVWAALDLPATAAATGVCAADGAAAGAAGAAAGVAGSVATAGVIAGGGVAGPNVVTATRATVRDMRAAGRAADPDHRDPSPAARLSRAAG
jgi:hypothetical protein